MTRDEDETRPVRPPELYPSLHRIKQARDRALQARSMLGASVPDTGSGEADAEVLLVENALEKAESHFRRAIDILTKGKG